MELMVLILTLVVALSLLGFGTAIAIIEIKDPTVDTSTASTVLLNLITTILGALLGLLAGKSERFNRQASVRKEDDESDSGGSRPGR